eukprot:Hpha_TRINITY_DN14827_c0_g1::TRINITY_DN14827_c0_g1_i2::g.169832::m.169832
MSFPPSCSSPSTSPTLERKPGKEVEGPPLRLVFSPSMPIGLSFGGGISGARCPITPSPSSLTHARTVFSSVDSSRERKIKVPRTMVMGLGPFPSALLCHTSVFFTCYISPPPPPPP